MRVANFSLLIPEGKELDSGHIELPHATTYHIKLLNHCHSRRCDAKVVVDGKEIGLFRVGQGGYIELERPVDDTGKFTFFAVDSSEAQAAGAVGIAMDLRGLIQVTFKPEKKAVAPVAKVGSMRHLSKGLPGLPRSWGSEKTAGELRVGCCYDNTTPTSVTEGFQIRSAGVTGLTGQSSQTYYEVSGLDYDPAEEVTISVRLVCGPAVRPLVAKANPVPAAVE